MKNKDHNHNGQISYDNYNNATGNNHSLRLTKNDQTVLKNIMHSAKMHDAEIAEKMGLTQQAVFKIRHKLERYEIIQGYIPLIDFKKIGIESLLVLGLKLTPFAWEKYSESSIATHIQQSSNILLCFRIPESHISHLLIVGFRNNEEMDAYIMNLQTKCSKEVQIVYSHPFSVDRIIKANYADLLTTIFEKRPVVSSPCFLQENIRIKNHFVHQEKMNTSLS